MIVRILSSYIKIVMIIVEQRIVAKPGQLETFSIYIALLQMFNPGSLKMSVQYSVQYNHDMITILPNVNFFDLKKLNIVNCGKFGIQNHPLQCSVLLDGGLKYNK